MKTPSKQKSSANPSTVRNTRDASTTSRKRGEKNNQTKNPENGGPTDLVRRVEEASEEARPLVLETRADRHGLQLQGMDKAKQGKAKARSGRGRKGRGEEADRVRIGIERTQIKCLKEEEEEEKTVQTNRGEAHVARHGRARMAWMPTQPDRQTLTEVRTWLTTMLSNRG